MSRDTSKNIILKEEQSMNAEFNKFICFVDFVIEKLKPLPKNQRSKAFDSLMVDRDDKDLVKKSVYARWKN